jgi:hypothetical protein
MASPARVQNRVQTRTADRHYPATVTAAGPPATVALDPDATPTTAVPLAGSYPAGARVLVVVTAFGNYILGRIG